MEIVLKRTHKKKDYTIGDLYLNGLWYCNTLEDTDRNLTQEDDLKIITNLKILHKTAIPTGTYKISLNIISPKYSLKPTYNSIGGKLPRLLNVPGFEGILIHIGNSNEDTSGCILVGKNKIKSKLVESTKTFFNLYKELLKCNLRKEEITITIE